MRLDNSSLGRRPTGIVDVDGCRANDGTSGRRDAGDETTDGWKKIFLHATRARIERDARARIDGARSARYRIAIHGANRRATDGMDDGYG